jgi:hypothetical protein
VLLLEDERSRTCCFFVTIYTLLCGNEDVCIRFSGKSAFFEFVLSIALSWNAPVIHVFFVTGLRCGPVR